MKDTWPESGEEKQTYLIHRRDFIEALLGVLPEGMVQLGHGRGTTTDNGGSPVLTCAHGEPVTAATVGGTEGTGHGHGDAGMAALDVFSEWKAINVAFSGKLQRAQIDTEWRMRRCTRAPDVIAGIPGPR